MMVWFELGSVVCSCQSCGHDSNAANGRQEGLPLLR